MKRTATSFRSVTTFSNVWTPSWNLCHVSHLAICHFWFLPIWPPTASISVVSIQQVEIIRSILFTESSCRLQVFSMLLALLFGPPKYCVGGSEPLLSGFTPYLRQQACVPSSLPAILLFDQVYFSTTSFHFSLFLHLVKKFLDG